MHWDFLEKNIGWRLFCFATDNAVLLYEVSSFFFFSCLCQVELAERVIRRLRSYITDDDVPADDSSSDDDEVVAAFTPGGAPKLLHLQHPNSVKQLVVHFDELVCKYAEKALEFPSSFVPPLVDGKNSRTVL